jgi:hypothetical protein
MNAWERDQIRLEAAALRGRPLPAELRQRVVGAVGDLVVAEAARTERAGAAPSRYVAETLRLLVLLHEGEPDGDDLEFEVEEH